MEKSNSINAAYTVSESTTIFLDALRKFNEVTDAVIDGLVATYGEEEGHELFFNDFDKDLKAAEETLYRALNLSIRGNLCVLDTKVI